MSHPAPRTLEILLDVKRLSQRQGMSQEDLRVLLNQYLPVNRQIKGTRSGLVKLNRWLNPTSNGWNEPLAEIILAFEKIRKILVENA